MKQSGCYQNSKTVLNTQQRPQTLKFCCFTFRGQLLVDCAHTPPPVEHARHRYMYSLTLGTHLFAAPSIPVGTQESHVIAIDHRTGVLLKDWKITEQLTLTSLPFHCLSRIDFSRENIFNEAANAKQTRWNFHVCLCQQIIFNIAEVVCTFIRGLIYQMTVIRISTMYCWRFCLETSKCQLRHWHIRWSTSKRFLLSKDKCRKQGNELNSGSKAEHNMISFGFGQSLKIQ